MQNQELNPELNQELTILPKKSINTKFLSIAMILELILALICYKTVIAITGSTDSIGVGIILLIISLAFAIFIMILTVLAFKNYWRPSLLGFLSILFTLGIAVLGCTFGSQAGEKLSQKSMQDKNAQTTNIMTVENLNGIISSSQIPKPYKTSLDDRMPECLSWKLEAEKQGISTSLNRVYKKCKFRHLGNNDLLLYANSQYDSLKKIVRYEENSNEVVDIDFSKIADVQISFDEDDIRLSGDNIILPLEVDVYADYEQFIRRKYQATYALSDNRFVSVKELSE